MPLADLTLPEASTGPLPGRIQALIEEAERRMDGFLDGVGAARVAGFVPSDFERVYRELQTVERTGLAPGRFFCEWGSGFGVVAIMASHLGFDACGIEIDADLVDEAEDLAEAFDLEVEFACGTFVPPGGEDLTDVPTEFGWLSAGGRCGHAELGLDPSDFDLVFAYPWPGEEQIVENLFERYAATGALLLTYHGYEDLRLRRKVRA